MKSERWPGFFSPKSWYVCELWALISGGHCLCQSLHWFPYYSPSLFPFLIAPFSISPYALPADIPAIFWLTNNFPTCHYQFCSLALPPASVRSPNTKKHILKVIFLSRIIETSCISRESFFSEALRVISKCQEKWTFYTRKADFSV